MQIVDRLHWYAEDGDMVRFAHKRYLLGLTLLFCLLFLSFFLILKYDLVSIMINVLCINNDVWFLVSLPTDCGLLLWF